MSDNFDFISFPSMKKMVAHDRKLIQEELFRFVKQKNFSFTFWHTFTPLESLKPKIKTQD